MKVELHPAYVLHYRPYRETSLLLDAFSRDHGRVSLIARGAKRKNSGTALLLQPYQRLQLAWSGKSELMTLTRVEADGPACAPDQENLIAAFYINELVMRLLHQHEAHTELFSAYAMTITALARAKSERQAVIRIFEKRLLQALGYGLVLDHDVETGMKISNGLDYYYVAERGPVRTAPDHNDHVRISGMTLLALLRENLEQKTALQESRKLMRYILQRHLGRKPLASRELYASYMKMTRRKQPVS